MKCEISVEFREHPPDPKETKGGGKKFIEGREREKNRREKERLVGPWKNAWQLRRARRRRRRKALCEIEVCLTNQLQS